MSINKEINTKTQMGRHQAVAKRYETVALEAHMLACEDLVHARTHGDISLCKHLFITLGGSEKGKSFAHTRVEALKFWFVKMSGNQMTAEGGEWKMKKGWSAEKFLSEDEMEKTPYWSLVSEKTHDNMSWETILKLLTGLPKRIDKAVDEDKFNGDPEAIKSVVIRFTDYAKVEASKLTKQQTGEVSNNADALLAAADSKGQTRTAVVAAKALERAEEGLTVDAVEPELETVAA